MPHLELVSSTWLYTQGRVFIWEYVHIVFNTPPSKIIHNRIRQTLEGKMCLWGVGALRHLCSFCSLENVQDVPDVSLAKEKVKIEKIHLVWIQQHHITLGVVSSLIYLLFFMLSYPDFFCVIWSSNGPGNANNPGSEGVQWRDCWDRAGEAGWLATLKARIWARDEWRLG